MLQAKEHKEEFHSDTNLERLLLLRKAVSECLHTFFTTSEIPVVLLVVVSLTVWWGFFSLFLYSSFFLFF